uniref:elongation factor-like GTPase 1 isoform X1 n=1 Tax=Ciona intestinalis TaxID=7719 RepID=UPI000EF4CED5|nr:elongation factor-like GTPase 1 isoform X1 [Ciona intestinalis]XP_026695034.1 elongation factor-like GTPase 1 isoform X1 [Ciona intestinalis]|eukprot:XP_026695033.1 elongation factor-like GTPase 1 isoform X1 [Ciona intestinalis]
MKATDIENVKQLQKNSQNIRNICILAHVDHGKTTLADALIASNGIISKRMAGKLRYMDSRDDEQLRGITMKSSAISLRYALAAGEEYLINLIDSPGHVDFGSEVCTAVRLCDGAIVVVDVVEGVCPQTHAVLRQAWLEKLSPILVLNKIDRLITELKFTPEEAHLHLQQVLEQVNAVTGSLYSAEVLEKIGQTESSQVETENGEEVVYDWSSGIADTDDSKLYFSPSHGNVVFASAADGWGFKKIPFFLQTLRIQHFSRIFSTKLGIREKVLNRTLWGDYYVNNKAKKILKGAQAKGKKTLFVQFILENLWSIYDAVYIRRDKERSEKITKSLNLNISARDVRVGKSEPKTYLQAICGQWLPLAEAVLSSVCQYLPSPSDISGERVEGLMCGSTRSFSALHSKSQDLKQDFLSCGSDSSTTIVLVSKMVAVDSKLMPQNKQRPLTVEEIVKRRELVRQKHAERKLAETNSSNHKEDQPTDADASNKSSESPEISEQVPEKEEKQEQFVAFARVFSGTLKVGQKLYVLGPKYDPAPFIGLEDSELEEAINSNPHISVTTVTAIYLWMGRELEALEEAASGCIIGIGGLEEVVLNSATLCSSMACPPFNALTVDVAPIIRVAVESYLLSEMSCLVEGLKLLNQADPCVQVMVQETGEHVIIAAGEVHLQRCLDDLKNRFAKIEIKSSAPIVPFRETVIPRPKVDVLNELIETQDKDIMQKWNLKDKESGDGNLTKESEKLLNAKSKKGIVVMETPNKQSTLVVRAVSLPPDVIKLLEENGDLLKVLSSMEAIFKDLWFHRRRRLLSTGSNISSQGEEDGAEIPSLENNVTSVKNIIKNVLFQLKIKPETLEEIKKLKSDLETAFENAGRRKWSNAVEHIWAFGPRGNGPNILLNKEDDYRRPSIWTCVGDNVDIDIGSYRECDHSIISGFQLATLSGPLCEEPMYGICFVIEEWKVSAPPVSSQEHKETKEEQVVTFADDLTPVQSNSQLGPLSGQLISTSKESCRRSFQAQPQRLMAAMYTCNIQATG